MIIKEAEADTVCEDFNSQDQVVQRKRQRKDVCMLPGEVLQGTYKRKRKYYKVHIKEKESIIRYVSKKKKVL